MTNCIHCGNSAETAHFHKISTTENQVASRYFSSNTNSLFRNIILSLVMRIVFFNSIYLLFLKVFFKVSLVLFSLQVLFCKIYTAVCVCVFVCVWCVCVQLNWRQLWQLLETNVMSENRSVMLRWGCPTFCQVPSWLLQNEAMDSSSY